MGNPIISIDRQPDGSYILTIGGKVWPSVTMEEAMRIVEDEWQ